MAGDPFDSSDQEFSDLEADTRFAHLGLASIERMRDNQLEMRLASKKSLKKLEKSNTRRCEGTARSAALWENRFNAFYTEVLGKPRGQMPMPDDVLRFFTQLPMILGPNRIYSRDAYSVGAIQDANYYIVEDILYKHESAQSVFRTANFALKFRSLTQNLVNDGFLTRQAARDEKQWVGAHLLAKMCQALLLRSASHGTFSWDYRLQQALLLALMCGTAGRIGDILNSYRTGPQNLCLAWEHVVLKLKTEDDGGETVVGKITLKYTKGAKDTSENLVHRFRPLPAEYASACIIRLLLTHALRMGAIRRAPRSFEEVLKGMRGTPARTIRWQNPKDPVFLGHGGSNSDFMLIPGKPARSYMGKVTLRYAADLVGLPVTLICHDIRRGSARDVASLPSQELPQLRLEAARRVLGHSHNTYYLGITEEYVGPETADNYGVRVRKSEYLRAQDDFGLDGSYDNNGDRAFIPRRLTAAEVTRFCEENGWSITDRISRDRAGKVLRQAQRDAWASERDPSTAAARESAQDDNEYDEEPAPKRPRTGTAATSLVANEEGEEDAVSGNGAPLLTDHRLPTGEGADGYYDDEEAQGGGEPLTERIFDAFMESSVKFAQSRKDLGLIDPDLLMMMKVGPDQDDQQLEESSCEEQEHDPTMPVPSSLTTRESGLAVRGSGSYLVTSGDAAADEALSSNIKSASLTGFVDCLSRVNLVTRLSPKEATRQKLDNLSAKTHAEYESILDYPTSKDVLKQTRFKCPFSENGCTKTCARSGDMVVHADSCSFAPAIEILDCPEEDCDVKCAGEANLKAHLRRHERKSAGYSMSCREPGCNGGPYPTVQAVRQHLNLSHGYDRVEARLKEAEWSANDPEEDGEEEEATGSTATASSAAQLVTGYPKQCPLPADCKSTYVFRDRDSLRKHFRQMHNMTNGQARVKENEFKDVPHAPVIYKARETNKLGYSMICRIPGCKGRGKPMTFPGSVLAHLKNLHGMSHQQAKRTEQEWSEEDSSGRGQQKQPETSVEPTK